MPAKKKSSITNKYLRAMLKEKGMDIPPSSPKAKRKRLSKKSGSKPLKKSATRRTSPLHRSARIKDTKYQKAWKQEAREAGKDRERKRNSPTGKIKRAAKKVGRAIKAVDRRVYITAKDIAEETLTAAGKKRRSRAVYKAHTARKKAAAKSPKKKKK